MTPDDHAVGGWKEGAATAADSSSPVAVMESQGDVAEPSTWRQYLGVALVAMIMLSLPLGGLAQTKPVGEYELKAAFLAKLPLFVQWPATGFTAPGSPLVIGVLGENPFGLHLENAAHGKVIEGHPLLVQACRDFQEAAHCHIVYVSGGDERAIEAILRQFAGTSVMTVSDAANFASLGGMVNLVTGNKKVRLEVNLEAMKRVGVRMDPQLLQMVKVVTTATSAPAN